MKRLRLMGFLALFTVAIFPAISCGDSMDGTIKGTIYEVPFEETVVYGINNLGAKDGVLVKVVLELRGEKADICHSLAPKYTVVENPSGVSITFNMLQSLLNSSKAEAFREEGGCFTRIIIRKP